MAGSDQIIKSNEDFGGSLYKLLAKEGTSVFFSPLSAHAALSLVYQGAGGKTAESFKSVLKLEGAKSAAKGYKQILSYLNSVKNVTLDIANKVYVKSGYKLKSGFQNVAKDSFSSEIEQVNFEQSETVADAINLWIEKKTNNKLKNMVSKEDLNEDTRLLLVNAIYFKGKWKYPFEAERTKKVPFYLSKQDTVDVDMMNIKEYFNFARSKSLEADILELPYLNSDLSLLIILPRAIDGLSKLEEKLGCFSIRELKKDLHTTMVWVCLPKFKIETTMDLEEVLSDLGLGIIFSNLADFSGLLETPEALKVSKVVQKAFIEVSEEGTEAAAVTIPRMMLCSMPPVFNANHPFFFALLHKNTILFEGRFQPHETPKPQ